MRTIVEIQQRLIDLNFSVGPDGADGHFGKATLEAYNAFLLSKGRPPIREGEDPDYFDVVRSLFPEDTKPKRNTVFGKLLASFFLNQLKGQIPMLSFLDGYKTYVVGGVAVVIGAAAMLGWSIPGLPAIPPNEGWQLILTGLAALGLRRAVTTGK